MGYLSTAEAARRWGVSERSVRNYCAQGRVAGAIRTGRAWLVPEGAPKPRRKNATGSNVADFNATGSNAANPNVMGSVSPLLRRLREERDGRIRGGIYHKLQVEFTYNSNHIEGSRLTLDQTRRIFETATIGADGEVYRVDDIVETANHFRCIDYCLDVAERPLSESIIREFHRLLKNGTTDAGLGWFAVGDYKRVPNEVGGRETTAPAGVPRAMTSLLERYGPGDRHDLRDLIDFHVRFERIHPFQDGNGRVGRLILLKECLRESIVPFVISDDMRWYYYRGIAEWDHEDGFLTDTCLSAQDRFRDWLDYFEIPAE